jgi:hypothetical protein
MQLSLVSAEKISSFVINFLQIFFNLKLYCGQVMRLPQMLKWYNVI